MEKKPLVLVTISGKDTPGIVSAMAQIIARTHTKIMDIEQVVIHNTIILTILMDFTQNSAEHKPVLKELLFEAKRLELDMDFSVLSHKDFTPRTTISTYALTCVGENISARVIAKISSILAKRSVNIERIGKLSEGR